MDVTREDGCDAAGRARAPAAFGGLDIMICNAGFGYYGTVEETPPDIMRRMMDVNFMGTLSTAPAPRSPVFRAQGRGHLMLVSSIVGQRGIALMSGYSATKAAQVGFAESLRSEFAGTDIHVSVVFPVSTETEFRDAMDARLRAHRLRPRTEAVGRTGGAARSSTACAVRAPRSTRIGCRRRWRSSTPSRRASPTGWCASTDGAGRTALH